MGADLLYASRAMRHGFLRKVLGIVAAQLLLTAAIAAPILLAPGPRAWLAANTWAVALAGIVTFASLICLVCSEAARRSFPSNILLLGAFTAAQGVLVGVACAAYSTPSVLLAVLLAAGVCVALIGYALQTRYDFTAAGGMLYSALWVLLLGMLAHALLPRVRVLDVMVAGCGALVFSCYLVFDVQLLVAGEHSCAVSVDEPVVAALNIYVDVINLFLYILQIIGRDED
ncbi:MAG: inhibitor of apoptosis-promoting Bax1-domain-containing protein [Monoraphidium minutum]|nr:MAG: inhibitor of apoptosis-promoting Bax1-domain-containing protein [Monoraphidium minutum]